MPGGTWYRTFGMVLGMYEMNVVLYEKHQLCILHIAGETLYFLLSEYTVIVKLLSQLVLVLPCYNAK